MDTNALEGENLKMRITVKLFAYLRQGRFKSSELELADLTSIGQVLDSLAISRQEMQLGILFINGRHAKFDSVLQDGDTLAIFPPVAGG